MCYPLSQQTNHSPWLLSMKQAPPASISLPHSWSHTEQVQQHSHLSQTMGRKASFENFSLGNI